MSYDAGFIELLNTFPDVILEHTGVGLEQTDFATHMYSLMGKGATTMADISSDPNANVAEATVASAMQESSKPLMKLYCLNEIYKRSRKLWGRDTADRLVTKIIEGGLYPSDLHLFFTPYCYNYSIGVLMQKGLPFISRTPSVRASHADSYVQHVTQLIMYASNTQSGAVAITGFFVGYAWYAAKDGLSKKEILQHFQNFTYTINQPVRFSAQTPFVNLSVFDREYLTKLYGEFVYPDGTVPNIEFVMELQKMYVEWLVDEMKSKKIVFTFPVMTASLLKDAKTNALLDADFADWLSRVNSEFAFINIYMSEKASSLSSCCRLSNDLDLLAELGYVNSFGAGGDGIGSVGVCTVNLPHVALRAKVLCEEKAKAMSDGEPGLVAPKPLFFELLKEYVADAQKIVRLRRDWIIENIAKGLLPLYRCGFIDINSQYNTIGICGMYECADFLGESGDIASSYVGFAVDVLGAINALNLEESKTTGVPYNCEQVPAENQAVKMAEKDRLLGLQNKFRIYSNQWIPLTSGVDVITRMHLAGKLDNLCSGGAILHITVDGKISPSVQRRLLTMAAERNVRYFTFNYVISRCSACGKMVAGDIRVCECGSTNIEAFTRVVGFITPVSHWSRERRDEFHKRTRYSLDMRQKEFSQGDVASVQPKREVPVEIRAIAPIQPSRNVPVESRAIA